MIKLNDILIKYGDFIAMKDLNLEIKEGEFFSFLGPSGSGKTTILRAITGFVKPTSGKIMVKDRDITNLPIEKRNIGIVFQSYALFPTMNVYENIAYGLKVRKMPKEQIHREIMDTIKKIDLDESHLYKKISELSGGQQQRVAIARAMIIKPEILCLDEPLSNLDAKLRQKLRLELKILQKELGITTIYVTHDQEEALTLSDKIAVFDNGKLHQVGSPLEIYNNPKTEFVANFIGEINKINGESFIKETNHQIDKNLPVYILINKVSIDKSPGDLSISGIIKEVEYFGFYIKYTLEKNEIEIKFIEFLKTKNIGTYQKGDKATVYISKEDLKQYGSDNL